MHPDRNYGDTDNATARFAEIQTAYETLSDPQERAWYDSHRESILRGGNEFEDDHFEQNVRFTSAQTIVSLIARFNPNVPFTDAPNGFFGMLKATFAALADEEAVACRWDGLEVVEYPDFGSATDDYEDVVKPFYRVWANFSTQKSFSWKEGYRPSDAPDRATKRLIEKENKKLRDEGKTEFNDAIRHLVTFVRKRDPRYLPNFQTEANRQKILRNAAAAQAARSRAANQAKLDKHIIPDWAKPSSPEDEVDFSESEESEVEHIECVVCGKTFKSEKQYEAHEKSKKHLKAVQELRKHMQKENQALDLDAGSESSPETPDKDLDKLKLGSVNDELQNLEANDSETVVRQATSLQKKSQEMIDQESSNADPFDFADTGDDYAPREAVEERLVGAKFQREVKSSQHDEMLSVEEKATPSTTDQDGELPEQKLGKAKAKRAKKIAKQEAEQQSQTVTSPSRKKTWITLTITSSNVRPAISLSFPNPNFLATSKNLSTLSQPLNP